MHILFYPTKTSFINSQPYLTTRNMGSDEVVEIEKTVTDFGDTYLSRTILQFNHGAVSSSLSRYGISTSSITANLTLKSVETKGISSDYVIEAHKISGSWERGNGRKYDDNEYSYSGVSWTKRNNFTSGSWASVGGNYYPSSSLSQSFSDIHSDVSINISSFVNQWISGESINDGILLKLQDESSSVDYGKIRFFSNNTNTIYKPYLDLYWDSSSYNTGSLDTGSINAFSRLTGDPTVIIQTIRSTYSPQEEIRFDVFAKEKYVKKTFNRWPAYNYPYHDQYMKYILPETSYYSIIDAVTLETIINFDSGSKISSNSSGSFFICRMDFPINREYKILIKTIENQIVNIYTNAESFRVE